MRSRRDSERGASSTGGVRALQLVRLRRTERGAGAEGGIRLRLVHRSLAFSRRLRSMGGACFTSACHPSEARTEDAQLRGFVGGLLERVRAIPGVAEAGTTDALPFTDRNNASAL